MASFDPQMARKDYLERLFARYSTLTLPLDIAGHVFPLQAIFQPMMLHRDPFTVRKQGSGTITEITRARDGAEALAKSAAGRIIVLGGPGMGKTTALKALLCKAITAAQVDSLAPLPLFVSLPELARMELSLEEYIVQLLTDLDIDLQFLEVLKEAIQGGYAFLCLDSLDEILPALRPDVIAFLNREAPRCQGIWIIGSRFTEYKGGQFAHSQFAEWELQPLNEQERLALARQLLPALYDAFYAYTTLSERPARPTEEAYINALEQSTQMAAWAENPLLLSLAAIPYVETGRLPASRALLYAQVMDAIFAMRIPDAEQRVKLRFLLAEIALEFYQTRGRNFTTTDVLECLSRLAPDQQVQPLYTTLALILDSGVLEPVAYQTYGFKHQMFQEYLAAVALARRCVDETRRQEAWDLLWRKRRFSRWSEILRLLSWVLVLEHGAHGVQMAHSWLSALAQECSTPDGDPGHLCLILAMKSLHEAGDALAQSAVVELGRHILTIWEQATAKAFSMGGLQFALSLQEQTSVLSAFSLEIVLPILTHLQQLQPDILWHCRVHPVIDRTIPLSILAYLFQDKQSLSFYNCQTLPVLRTPEVLARMVAILENAEGNWRLEERAIVAQLLGCVGEQMPLALLARLCQDVTLDNNLRLAVAEALRDATIPVPQETFVTMLSDSETGLRCVALEGLARHGELPVDLLLAALHDPSYEVRRKALLVLLDQGVSLPIELLQTLLYDKAGAVGGVAWDALRKMGQRVPLQLWLDALLHEQNHIRKYALESLKAYKDQLSAELLLEILALPNVESDVRADCMRALGLLDERAPLDPLLEALQDSNEHILLSALDVLNQLQIAVSASILLPLLNNRATGSGAAQALARLAEEAPISALLEMARSGSPDSARSAIQALRLLYAYVPIEPVLELLESEKFHYDTWYLIQLLYERGVEIPPRFLLHAVKYFNHEQSRAAEIVSLLCKADSRVPLESLLRLAYAEGHEELAVPEWMQQVFALLYEQVSPTILTQALSKVDDDQWLAVSLLGLMQNEENIRLITSVAQDPAGDHLVRSEAMVVLSDAGVNLPLKYLLEATSWSIYEGMSWYLADTVERLGKQAPFEELLPFVGDDDYGLRHGVVQALIRIARDLPLEAILPLLEDQNEHTRSAAFHILAAMRERAPLAVFTALLHDSGQTLDTRCDVLGALGELGTAAAVDVLVEALECDVPELRMRALLALKDNEWEIRRGGMRACREEGKEIPLEPLVRLLEDPDMQVIETTIDLCSDLGLLGMPVPVGSLLSLLKHEDESIVQQAAEALISSGERVPVDMLLARFSSANDEWERGGLLSALTSLGSQIPLDAVLALLADKTKAIDNYARESALDSLFEAMPEQMLRKFHDDPSPMMRRRVLRAVQSCEWLPLVLATLDDPGGVYAAFDHELYGYKGTIRSAAARALGRLHACAPVEPLLKLLSTNKEDISYNDERVVVLESLKPFGTHVPLEVLWPLLGSAHSNICKLAFEHIQQAYPAALEELEPVLRSMLRGEAVQGAFAPRGPYRSAEMVALMGRATPEVVDIVVDLLDFPFWEVRVRAAQTLGALRRNIPDRAIQRLIELRKDPESIDVQTAAELALAEILSLEQGMEEELGV